ncbi:MAG: hypothetical protein SPF99_06585 [Anaerobutyricum sp.]|nr:hypothetical protein [Anaerobutyricum sp.]
MKKRISIIMATIFVFSMMFIPVSTQAATTPVIKNNQLVLLKSDTYHLQMPYKVKKVVSDNEDLLYPDVGWGNKKFIDLWSTKKGEANFTITYKNGKKQSLHVKVVDYTNPVKYVKIGSYKFTFKKARNKNNILHKRLGGTQKVVVKPKKNWKVRDIQYFPADNGYLSGTPKHIKNNKKYTFRRHSVNDVIVCLYNKKTHANAQLFIRFNERPNSYQEPF